MADLKVGDFVFDPSDIPTQVIATSETFVDHHCYKLVFTGGVEIICDQDHLWPVWYEGDDEPLITTTANLWKAFQNSVLVWNVGVGNKIRYLLEMSQVDSVPVRCIAVDNPNGLFQITRHGLVTHNSRTAAEKIHAYLKKYPGTMGLMLRKQRQSMTNSTVLFFERTVIGPDPTVKHFPSKFRFEYDNGSILAYGGMDGDEQKEQIRSIGQEGSLHIAWMEEANRFTEDDYNEILARMRGANVSWLQVILTTNPDAPTHWIYRRLILGKEAKVYYSKAADNDYNPKSYINTLNKLTGVTRDRLALGKWVQAEGVVFEGFDPDIHVIDSFQIPSHWRRVRGIDFGLTAPFVCTWAALDPIHDRIYVYRQIYMTKRTVKTHAESINFYSQGEEIEATVCDHDAEDRLTLEENEIDNIPANKDMARGIDLITERLQIPEGSDKPRLLFFRDLVVEVDETLLHGKHPTSVLEEFPAWTWARKSDGTINPDKPISRYDHGLDTVRYIVMYFDGDGAAGMDFGSLATSDEREMAYQQFLQYA